MRKILTLLAVLCVLGVICAWVATGADTGWSKTQVQVMDVEPVTGLEFPVWKDQVVFGVDFLIAGLAGALVIAGIAFLMPKPKTKT